MAVAIKLCASAPVHDKRVGIRQQHHAIATTAKIKQGLQIVWRHHLEISQPCFLTFFVTNLSTKHLAHSVNKFGCCNGSFFQFAKHPTLGIRVQDIGSIAYAHICKTSHSLVMIQSDNNTTKIENQILYHSNKLSLFFLASSRETSRCCSSA